MDKGLAVVAINSNDVVAYPDDAPVAMALLARAEQWRFPFLFDETQEVARALGAECTPDLYVFSIRTASSPIMVNSTTVDAIERQAGDGPRSEARH